MNTTFKRFTVILGALPVLAFGATDSKYISDKINVPVADDYSVSAAKAEVEAKKLFCGIQGSDCKTDDLASKCEAAESKKELSGFRCNVYTKEPTMKTAFDALSITLSRNLAYHSSARTARPADFDPAKQSKTRVKAKGANQ